VDGESLEQRIAKAGAKMPLSLVKDLACEIADALAYAHANNVVHGRLTPSNILIAASDDHAFVTDFGTPNVGSGPGATAAKALVLDASYLSPEQCVGEAPCSKSDQYALGVTLYEMLTGRPPFVGKSAFAIMKQHCDATPVSIAEFRPDCPLAMEATVLRLLNKHPNERFFTTRELVNELRAWPLPDPGSHRDRISNSSVETRAAKPALASFERILANDPQLLGQFDFSAT
jgi:serine/threonine-protein kinase